MITIIDYGVGNLHSAAKGVEKAGSSVRVTSDPDVVAKADKLILPGVGAFKDCVDSLTQGGFVEPIREHIAAGKPLLGICVGMQLLFDESQEFGVHQGLGLIPGKVVRFPANMYQGKDHLKVPHMGWNDLDIRQPAPIFKGIDSGSYVYFVHSYYCQPEGDDVVAAKATYGDVNFCASVWKDNLMATQFHPEKSQDLGIQILKNFGEL